MKRLYFLTAAASMMLAANAQYTRYLYTENYETANDPADVNWTSPSNSAALSIAADEEGQYLQISHGQNNGRTYNCTWGSEIYGEGGENVTDGSYKLSFLFELNTAPGNQFNSCITVLSNLTGRNNEPYIEGWTHDGYDGYWRGFLFDLSQVNSSDDNSTTYMTWYVNGDQNDTFVMQAAWYFITLDVNVNTRVVDYDITSFSGENIKSGSYTVPEEEVDGSSVSMYAESMHVMVARYGTVFSFDDIEISCESSEAIASAPAVALSRIGKDASGTVDLNIRAYTITWKPDNTLHVIGTDGQEMEYEYDDYEGAYVYETTTSGTLKAWTTFVTSTSEVIEVEVDATPYALPTAEVTITGVEEGYGKTLKLTVDNSDVTLSPDIYINYQVYDENGNKIAGLAGDEVSSGTVITVTEAGTIWLQTVAYGYQATESTYTNDLEFEVKAVADFARATADEIKGYGFTAEEDLNSATTSGENNWTARHRLYYYDANTAVTEDGETTYTAVYPFGYSEDESAVLHRWSMPQTDGANNDAVDFMEPVHFWGTQAIWWAQGIGVYNNSTSGNYKTLSIVDLDAEDFVMINIISDYGSNSNHPICETADEYYAQLAGDNLVYGVGANTAGGDTYVSAGMPEYGASQYIGSILDDETGKYTFYYGLYRIDTAVTKITVFSQAGSGNNGIAGVTVDNEIKDTRIYNLQGIEMRADNLPAGIYIQGGKKFIVR